jgi:methyltransferase (TIGR00027 family)
MFKSLKRIVYQVDNLENAKQWYSKILNDQPLFETPFAVIFRVGDCSLSLALAKNSLPEFNDRVDVYWEVDDIDFAYNKLIEYGAKNHSEIKTVLNIRTAKVIDPFGNIIGLTGKAIDVEKRTIESQPSETAMSTAFCRALAWMDDREEIKGPDYLAENFLKDEAKKYLADSASRKWVIESLVSIPLYGYLMARTAYIDSIFINGLKENIPQIVFIGAGYDTRSYRFKEIIKESKIFELDAPFTQQRKIEILKNKNIQIPGSLSFVPINFKNEKPEDVLLNAGYDSSKQTLFIWEGVMYYLGEEAVDKILNSVNKIAPCNSTICFDYLTEKLESVNPAEPFLFWIGSDKLESFLSKRGFRIIQHLNSNEIEKNFLTLKDGSLGVRSLNRFCFVLASVSD